MSSPLAPHSWPHSMGSVYFSLKAFEVGGIRGTFCVLTVPNTFLWRGPAERCLADYWGLLRERATALKQKWYVTSSGLGVLILGP